MKSKAVALGHPIHPMLIPFLFAFLTGAADRAQERTVVERSRHQQALHHAF